jgi:tRNA A-37 threonylcarbamoyl transferase component Bud32
VEDKAVDLYVLERAFASTHPDSEPMFAGILDAYATKMGKEWPSIKKRLDEGE